MMGDVKKHPSKLPWKILQAYHRNRQRVVGLSLKTCQARIRAVGPFLDRMAVRRVADLARLTPRHLVRYFTVRSADYTPASLRMVASAVRDFLRFAQQRGWLRCALDRAVPQIACGAHNDLPVYLSRPELASLLASWDRSTAQGRRDRAIGLCLARLGLRAGEVAALVLEDIDWRHATVRVAHSKNGRPAQLPLLSEVGQALADYLRSGRPACPHRQVFVFHQPARPMNAQAVSRVIRRALRHCGLAMPRPGAHLLRHTLASHLVQNGASLKEVADLLRHRDLNSTAVYAHVDVSSLRAVAQPWPSSEARL